MKSDRSTNRPTDRPTNKRTQKACLKIGKGTHKPWHGYKSWFPDFILSSGLHLHDILKTHYARTDGQADLLTDRWTKSLTDRQIWVNVSKKREIDRDRHSRNNINNSAQGRPGAKTRGGSIPDYESDKIESPTKLLSLPFCLLVFLPVCQSFCHWTCITACLPIFFLFTLSLPFFLDIYSPTLFTVRHHWSPPLDAPDSPSGLSSE